MEAKRTPPSRPPNPALPYREDCWSEGETSVLIDAWGDRYVELNRGNLRQKQWQEVADAVNSRPCDARRPPRTDVQCKNRIDTLKKKYKAEKSKIAGDGAHSSEWIFYDRLDELIGPSVASAPPKKLALPPPPPSSPPMALPLPPHRKGFPLPTAVAVEDSFYRRRYSPENDNDGSESSFSRPSKRPRALPPLLPVFKEGSAKGLKRGKEEGIRELSKAILRLGEIYEKAELEKNKQMMELEKQRIEFAKSLEMQRMQMFVDTQVEIMKMGRSSKRGGNRTDDMFQGGRSDFIGFRSDNVCHIRAWCGYSIRPSLCPPPPSLFRYQCRRPSKPSLLQHERGCGYLHSSA